MTTFDLNEVSKALEGSQGTAAQQNGVSFENKNLKLDTVDDGENVV